MTDSSSPDRRRDRRQGLTLVEIILTIIIVGAALSPLVASITRERGHSRRNKRIAVAESLARDAIEFLHWRKASNGFDYLWNLPGTFTSGISWPGGDNRTNPQIDPRYRASSQDPDILQDRFDRVVRLRRQTVAAPPGSIRVLEITVTIYNPNDPALARRSGGTRPYFQILTYIGEGSTS